MQRLNLTWLADAAPTTRAVSTFRTAFWITIVYIVVRIPLAYSKPFITDDDTLHLILVLDQIIGLLWFVFVLVLITKTRKHIRDKYSINQKNCKGCEDCCCGFWCGCCTIAQMARHTADYENYAARCCSDTGLGPNAPAIV